MPVDVLFSRELSARSHGLYILVVDMDPWKPSKCVIFQVGSAVRKSKSKGPQAEGCSVR